MQPSTEFVNKVKKNFLQPSFENIQDTSVLMAKRNHIHFIFEDVNEYEFPRVKNPLEIIEYFELMTRLF